MVSDKHVGGLTDPLALRENRTVDLKCHVTLTMHDLRRISSTDGSHQAWLGDCLTALRMIPTGSVDLVFLDPPYNLGKDFGNGSDRWHDENSYFEWCYERLEECLRVLAPSGSAYFMNSTQNMPYFDIWLRKRVHILSRIVWQCDSSGVQARKYFGSLYEPILFCVKDRKNYVFNADDIAVEARTGAQRRLIDYRKREPSRYGTTKVPGNVWYIPRVRYRMPEYENHPTQKPEALLDRIILASTLPGQLVLDPFAGTFTCAAVARRLGRRSISIEVSRDYFKIGLRRVDLATEFDGEFLQPPEKPYARRHRKDPAATGAAHEQAALL